MNKDRRKSALLRLGSIQFPTHQSGDQDRPRAVVPPLTRAVPHAIRATVARLWSGFNPSGGCGRIARSETIVHTADFAGTRGQRDVAAPTPDVAEPPHPVPRGSGDHVRSDLPEGPLRRQGWPCTFGLVGGYRARQGYWALCDECGRQVCVWRPETGSSSTQQRAPTTPWQRTRRRVSLVRTPTWWTSTLHPVPNLTSLVEGFPRWASIIADGERALRYARRRHRREDWTICM